MNNKILNITMFIVGAAIGSVATWKYVKKKYERIAQVEIDSVKDVFSKKEHVSETLYESIQEPINDTKAKASRAKEKPGVIEYAEKLQDMGYIHNGMTKRSGDNPYEKGEEIKSMIKNNSKKPYVITPEYFGDKEEYDTISLTYYSDLVLADEDDVIVDDIDRVVGLKSLNHFGEYEDDSVFVRNERLKVDYEILLDQRKYSDAVYCKPHQMEV